MKDSENIQKLTFRKYIWITGWCYRKQQVGRELKVLTQNPRIARGCGTSNVVW